MHATPSVLPEARQILRLAREDKRAAESAVAALSLDDQVFLVCSAPLPLRANVLSLTPAPEEVIPRLPEAELCFTAKAVGLWDAGWILEHATASQLVAAIDLDCWKGLEPDRESQRAWLAALAESGRDTLLRAARALDPELIVLMLRDRVQVMLDPKDEDWQPPPGAQTLEGQFYFIAKQPDDDLDDILKLLHVLFQEDYWLYFRMLQGVTWELESDLEEWSMRWRTGRLEDLGFPSWDEAMRIYGYLRPTDRARMPEDDSPLDVDPWQLPVFLPELPATVSQAHSVFQAAAELSDEERRGFFYAFIATANKVAVADRMPLGDADTLPSAIAAAAEVVSAGLEFVASQNGVSLAGTLRRVSLERLFRVGASLDGRKPPTTPERDDTPEVNAFDETERPENT